MKVNPQAQLPAIVPAIPPPGMSPDLPPGHEHVYFKDVLAGVNAAMHESSDIYRSIRDFQNSVIAGKSISSKELLVFQIRASQFGVHVELVSKVAESGLSSVRRLQQTQ